MATADPNSYPAQVTVAVTAYPAVTAPTVNGSALIGAGYWDVNNPSGTLSIYVSFNGVDDSVIIPPGQNWASRGFHGPKMWLKLSAAGSVVVTTLLTAKENVP